MEWYEKFKINQEVKVIRKVVSWRYSGCIINWNRAGDMDITIGKFYKIKQIRKRIGFQLWTEKDTKYNHNFWYPLEALQEPLLVGEQLLFNFMNE